MEVITHYGALAEPLEVQLNHQGLTLGEQTDYFQDLNDAMILLYVQGLITDSQKDKIIKKLQKQIMKSLKVMK